MEGSGRITLIFCGEHRVPVISLTFDGTGFDGPFHFTMKLNLDMAYLAEMESLLDERIATLWIGERVVAVSTFEAWVPWLFPILDTSEEGLHRFVKTFEHILLNLAMDVLIVFSQGFDGRKLIGLSVVGN